MSLKVDLLESSFAMLAPQADAVVNLFYKYLFEDFPQVQPLFATVEMDKQKKKLLASLKLVVDNLRKPDVLVGALEEMGLRHVAYGAEEAHYPAVAATMLKSLAEVAGSDVWTEELNEAWSDALNEVSKHMIAGAAATAP